MTGFVSLKTLYMLHFDEHLTARIREAGKPLLPFWRFLASYGMWGFFILIVALSVFGIGTPISWFVLCIPVFLTHLLTLGLQLVVRRPRPSVDVALIQMWYRTPSFPSAHSAGSMAFAVMLSSVLIEQQGFGVLFVIGLITFAFLIGVSRIMVGVHYLGDVLAGFLFGLLITGIFLSVL